MLIQFVRWFNGYLRIQLIGYSPERFLNICKSKNIVVWDLKSFKNHYEMGILMKDFKKLKPLCKKTVSRVRIIDKKGFPFSINHLKKRKPFVAGLVLSIIFIGLSSRYLGTIEVNGNQKITYDVVCSYLEEQDINNGTSLSKINCKQIAADMRKEFEEIIWVSISLEGTKLCIELKENTDSIIVSEEREEPADLIAKHDAIISHIVTRNGVPMVQIGANVKKGDLLVSGSIPVYNDSKEIVSTNYVKADADIIGQIVLNYSDKIQSSYRRKSYTKKSIYWDFGPFKRNIKNKESKEIFTENNWLNLGTIKEYEWINTTYSKEERETILENNYQKYCDALKEEGKTILDSYFVINHYEEYSVAASYLRIEQPIEEYRKIIDLSSENVLQ